MNYLTYINLTLPNITNKCVINMYQNSYINFQVSHFYNSKLNTFFL